MLDLIDNAAMQGLSYASAVLGVAICFRVVRYPDLTPDGSFLLGSSTFAALLTAGWHWALALSAATLAGAAAGAMTALLHTLAGVNRLLSGILTSMAAYSLSFRILGGRSNVGIADHATLFTSAEAWDRSSTWVTSGLHPASLAIGAVLVGILAVVVFLLLRSDAGLLLRTTGENPTLVADLGRRPGRFRLLGLAIGNALVAVSGAVVSARQGFVDVNMGIGVIITLIAALVIGEEALRRLRFDPAGRLAARVLAPLFGAALYFLLYLLMLRGSLRGWLPIRIEPTDLKLLSAILVAIVFLVRIRRSTSEELLPL